MRSYSRTWLLPILAPLFALPSLAAEPEATPALTPSFEDAMRQPLVTIPLSGNAVIDGKVNVKGEYQPCAKLHDLITLAGSDPGVAGPQPTEVWVKYSSDALYVGFKVFLEPGAQPSITSQGQRDTAFGDDAFEILINTADEPGNHYHIGGNAGGTFWDRLMTGGKTQWEWNGDVQYAASVDAQAWMGEFRIGWKSFGLAGPPEEGTTWRFNVVANRHSPETRLESWSYLKSWHDPNHHGRIVFGGDNRPYLSIANNWTHAWNAAIQTYGLWPAIQVPRGKDNPRVLNYTAYLTRREVDPGTEASFYVDLQSLRDKATGEGATFATLAQDVQATLKSFEQVPNTGIANYRKQLPDPDFSVGWGSMFKVNRDGDYVMVYYITDITDPAKPFVVAGGAAPFRVRSGIQAAVLPYILTRRSVVVIGDMRAVPDRQSGKTLRAYVTGENDKKVLAQATSEYAGSVKHEVEVPIPNLPGIDGKYLVHLELLDAAGKAMSTASSSFKRPEDPVWWTRRDQYGSQPEVPWPWTPIQWNKKVAKVWGRDITFGDSALPRQIVNQGKEMLAAPIQLELRTAAGVAKLRTVSSKVLEERPGHLLLQTVQEGAGVRLSLTNRFEFDGFSLVDLTIEPVAGSAAVEGLDLVMPVRSDIAGFLTNYRIAPGPGKFIEGEHGMHTRYVGPLHDEYHSPPMINTWLGNDDMGLEWTIDNSRGWYLKKDPNRAIEIRRSGNVVEARFHYIDAPLTLDKPRQIRFGLLPTPTKLVPAERQKWRIDLAGILPPIEDTSATDYEKNYALWKSQYMDKARIDVMVCLSASSWTGYPFWHRYPPKPEAVELWQRILQRAHEHKIKALLNGGWAVSPQAPDWDPWGKEMIDLPQQPTFANQFNHTYRGPFVEFYVASFQENAKTIPLDGLRWDTIFPWVVTHNPYLGDSWVCDADGKTYGSYNIFRGREYNKRVYRVFHGGSREDGLVYHPAGGAPIMAIESFSDIREAGEGYYMNSPSLKHGYIQEQLRVWVASKPYGFIEQISIKGSPLTPQKRIGALLAVGARPRMLGRPTAQLPDYKDRSDQHAPAWQLWDAWEWIDRGTAQWHGHWSNRDQITSTSSLGGEHYVSFHLQPGKRVLLVATNYEPQPAQITVQLDLAKLGFSGNAALEARDAITGQSVPVDGGNTLRLDTGAELYRYIMLAAPGDLPPAKP